MREALARPSWRPQPAARFDPDVRRLALIAAAVGGGFAAVFAGLGALRSRPVATPVVEAASGPVRIKPLDPGGMQVAGADAQTPAGAERLAPPPEQPELAALRAKLRAAQKALAAARTAAAPPPAAPAAPARAALTVATPPVAVLVPPPPLTIEPPAALAVTFGTYATPAAAKAAWSDMVGRWPTPFAHHTPVLTHAGPAWRLGTAGFATDTEAARLCRRVVAVKLPCSPTGT